MDNIHEISYIGVDIAKSKFEICLYNGNFSSCVYDSYINDIDGFLDFFVLLKSVNYKILSSLARFMHLFL